jgi:hypothetical protein
MSRNRSILVAARPDEALHETKLDGVFADRENFGTGAVSALAASAARDIRLKLDSRDQSPQFGKCFH